MECNYSGSCYRRRPPRAGIDYFRLDEVSGVCVCRNPGDCHRIRRFNPKRGGARLSNSSLFGLLRGRPAKPCRQKIQPRQQFALDIYKLKVAPDNAWRCVLTFIVAICFMIGSLNIPGILLPFPAYERKLFGVLSSAMSGITWALSTTFKSAELSGSQYHRSRFCRDVDRVFCAVQSVY
jgi:hypothetical protein